MAEKFDLGSFLGRLLFALILVLCSYNPSGYSWLHWATAETTTRGPVVALAGVVLLIAWVIYLRATFISLGWVGIGLGSTLFACVVWLLVDFGWIDMHSTTAMSWLGLILMAFLLAVGMSWSHIRRRLSGQYDINEAEDE